MENLALITAIVFLLYIAIYEGSVLAMKDALQAGKSDLVKKWDMFWHTWSTIFRLACIPISVPFLWPLHGGSVYVLSVFILLAWVIWDAVCNFSRSKDNVPGNILQRFFYSGDKQSGTSSWIGRLLGTWMPYLKMVYLILFLFFTCYFIFG